MNAIAVSGSNVYVGGDFTTATNTDASCSATSVTVNGIAKWDGTCWTALGSGTSGTVRAIAVSGPNVYVGGAFTTAGGVTVNNVALWNGSWSALGSGTNTTVNAIAVSGSTVYVGGDFTTATNTTAGVVTVNRVASWNGTSWSSMADGFSDSVLALAISSTGTLYAGGYFARSGSTRLDSVAKWTGSSWDPLTGSTSFGTSNYVTSIIAASGGAIYIGGNFDQAGGLVGTNNVATWSGSDWSQLNFGVSGTVKALALDSSGTLYVGGSFTEYCGDASCSTKTTANRVASWAAASGWATVGSGTGGGLNSDVYALAISGTTLTAGGMFTATADNSVTLNRVARLLSAARTPTFSSPMSTSDGFTVNVTNYDASWTWTPTITSGTVTAGTASGTTLPLTVTGLAAGTSATVTVATTRSGYANGSATVSGSASSNSGGGGGGGGGSTSGDSPAPTSTATPRPTSSPTSSPTTAPTPTGSLTPTVAPSPQVLGPYLSPAVRRLAPGQVAARLGGAPTRFTLRVRDDETKVVGDGWMMKTRTSADPSGLRVREAVPERVPSREWMSVSVRGCASRATLDLFTIGATTRHRSVVATASGVAGASVALPRAKSGRPVLVQANCRVSDGPVLSVTWALT